MTYPMGSHSSVFDRAYGCLLGQAIGDALGTRYEFKSAQQTKSAIEKDMKQTGASLLPILGGGPFGMSLGQVTDDTEMALALARSMQRCGKFDIRNIARSYAVWFYSDPPDIGTTTRRAFGLLPPTSQGLVTWSDDAVFQSIMESSKRSNQSSLSNGCLMRISPLAIAGSQWPLDTLRNAAVSDCMLTHPNPLTHDAVSAYVTAIWCLINTGDRAKAYEETMARVHTETIGQLLQDDDPSVPIVTEDNDVSKTLRMVTGDGEAMGYLGVALKWAFMELRKGIDFQTSLIRVISRGGDTDTNGCITGALLGAAVGASNIPEGWKKAVLTAKPRRLENYSWASMEDAETLVKDLLKVAPQ